MTRILIVEDETAIAETLSEILSGEGYEVLVAVDGIDALERLGENHAHPDVILTDLMMPRVDGHSFITKLRARESLAQTPVIVMSAGTIAPDTRRDAASTLAKPFTIEALLSALDVVLRDLKV